MNACFVQCDDRDKKACSLPNMLDCSGFVEPTPEGRGVEGGGSGRGDRPAVSGGTKPPRDWASDRQGGGSGRWRRPFTPALELPKLRLPRFSRVTDKTKNTTASLPKITSKGDTSLSNQVTASGSVGGSFSNANSGSICSLQSKGDDGLLQAQTYHSRPQQPLPLAARSSSPTKKFQYISLRATSPPANLQQEHTSSCALTPTSTAESLGRELLVPPHPATPRAAPHSAPVGGRPASWAEVSKDSRKDSGIRSRDSSIQTQVCLLLTLSLVAVQTCCTSLTENPRRNSTKFTNFWQIIYETKD